MILPSYGFTASERLNFAPSWSTEWSSEWNRPVAACLLMREGKLSKQDVQTKTNSIQSDRYSTLAQFTIFPRCESIRPAKVEKFQCNDPTTGLVVV